nr:MAG TPA: Putative tranposon-transfer assisting protein [Caudoviricetes sp.]
MGKQFRHKGINNKMMGTETVEPVTQSDILEGQCGAANDGRPLPEEGEIGDKSERLIKKIDEMTDAEFKNFIFFLAKELNLQFYQ